MDLALKDWVVQGSPFTGSKLRPKKGTNGGDFKFHMYMSLDVPKVNGAGKKQHGVTGTLGLAGALASGLGETSRNHQEAVTLSGWNRAEGARQRSPALSPSLHSGSESRAAGSRMMPLRAPPHPGAAGPLGVQS